MTSATDAPPLEFPSRDELGLEDFIDATNMSEARASSLRTSIARAASKVPPGTDFFHLPWFRVLAAQKSVNALISFQHDLQQDPVNLKSDDLALSPYAEWIRDMKASVDDAQQELEGPQKARDELAKKELKRRLEGEEVVVEAHELDKAEFSGMGKGFAKAFAGGLERKKLQSSVQGGEKAADLEVSGNLANGDNDVEDKVQTEANARGKGSLGSTLAAAFASPDFVHDVYESEPIVERGRQPEMKPRGKGGDDEKKRNPNALGRKIAGAFAAGLGSDLEVQDAAEAKHSTLEREVSVARKKQSEAAAHFKGWRVVARAVEASMIARQLWPKPSARENVAVTSQVRGISTQKGVYKLEWPATWGWGPLTGGTTNFIEE